MEALWEIKLFGGLAVQGVKRRITRFRTRKSAALLGCLALRLSPQPREHLIDMLWPDAEPEAGRHNLSNALSSLRHILEPFGVVSGSVVEADRYNVALNAENVSVDAVRFESALRPLLASTLSNPDLIRQLETTLEIYRGPLLPGFYEDWISVESLRFDSLYGQGTKRLINLCLEERDLDKAIHWSQRAWKADPSDETAVHSLMKALDAAGKSSEALRVYHRFRREGHDGEANGIASQIASLADEIEGRTHRVATDSMATHAGREATPSALEAAVDNRASLEASTQQGVDIGERTEPEIRSKLIGDEFVLRTFTRFFGRTEEVAQLTRIMAAPRTRLITVTGPVGIGKTRFVLEAIAQAAETALTDSSPFTAFFVPLADISQPIQVLERLLKQLGGALSAGAPSADAVAALLSRYQRPLLILDNLENLASEGATLVRGLLLKSTNVRIVVTSRQRLKMDGEQVFTLAPLPLPDNAAPLDRLRENPSVALFIDRAEAVRQHFEVSPKNVSAIAQICLLLDGLPLAIELAAARVSIMSTSRILTEVQSNVLDFLGIESNGNRARPQTIRATLEWSFRHLPPDARNLLHALSVFRGGWTIEAAKAVWGGEEPDMLQLLTELRDASLVTVIDTDEGLRFTMLEVIREAATEELAKSGIFEYPRRHAGYFVKSAEEMVPGFLSAEGMESLRRLSMEESNLGLVRAWADGNPEDPINQELGMSLIRFWLSVRSDLLVRRVRTELADRESTMGLFIPLGGPMDISVDPDEVSNHLERAAALFEERGFTEAAGWSLVQLGYANLGRDLYLARKVAEKGVSLIRQTKNDTALAHAVNTLAVIACLQGEYVLARDLNTEAFSSLTDERACRTYDFAIHVKGIIAFMSGDHVLGEQCLKQNIEFARQSSDIRSEYAALYVLVRLYNEQGRFTESLELNERADVLFREARGGITYLSGYLACYVGYARFRLGLLPEALEALKRSLILFRDSKRTQGLSMSLVALAEIEASRRHYEIAAHLYGASEMLRRKHGRALDVQEGVWDALLRAAIQEGLGARFEDEVARGFRLSEHDSVALGFLSTTP